MKMRSRGFTVVELIVVIIVIAILATLVAFAFSTWRSRVAVTEMKSDLTNAAAALKAYRNFNSTYPASLSAISFTSSPNVSLTYTLRSGSVSYCLNAGSTSVTTAAHYYIDSAVSVTPTTTSCS